MKTKLATGALVGAILMGQYEAKAPEPEPKPKVIGIDDCIELAAAAVFIGSLYACFYHGIANDGTNVVHPANLWPWGVHRDADPDMDKNAMPSLHLSSVAGSECSDSFGFNLEAHVTVEVSTNHHDWSHFLDATIWESPVGHLLLASTNGVPIWTNYSERGPDGKSTNYCPFLPAPSKTKPNEYFRLLSQ